MKNQCKNHWNQQCNIHLIILVQGIHSEAVTSSRKCGGCQPSGTGSVVAAWLFATCHTWTEPKLGTWKGRKSTLQEMFRRSLDATFNSFITFSFSLMFASMGQLANNLPDTGHVAAVSWWIAAEKPWFSEIKMLEITFACCLSPRALPGQPKGLRCGGDAWYVSRVSRWLQRWKVHVYLAQVITAWFRWNNPKKISFSPSLGSLLLPFAFSYWISVISVFVQHCHVLSVLSGCKHLSFSDIFGLLLSPSRPRRRAVASKAWNACWSDCLIAWFRKVELISWHFVYLYEYV